MAEVARRPLPPAARACFSQQLLVCQQHPDIGATKPRPRPRPGPVQCKMGQSPEKGPRGYDGRAAAKGKGAAGLFKGKP